MIRMKIVHIAPNAPYNEGWGYQENYLPRYQALLGHKVILVVTNTEHKNGKIEETLCTDTVSAEGFRVIRRKIRKVFNPALTNILSLMDVYDILREEKPDFIFFHGLVSATIFQVCRYKRKLNNKCVIVQDNHLDYNIGTIPSTIKRRVVRAIYRMYFRLTKKYIARVYGVTPWREVYAQDYFAVPSSMTDVLIMGAADEKLHLNKKAALREEIRKEYNIRPNEFLIVTGAKIDKKKNIHLLMEAVNQLDGVRLIVFGNVLDDIKDEFERQLSPKVKWIGFIDSDRAYDFFLSADLVVFPGQHSVFWEQACACKVPCLFARWPGMEHVNNGGNSEFIDDISVDGIREKISELRFTPKYEKMKLAAESSNTDIYLYSKIAEKSLETVLKSNENANK